MEAHFKKTITYATAYDFLKHYQTNIAEGGIFVPAKKNEGLFDVGTRVLVTIKIKRPEVKVTTMMVCVWNRAVQRTKFRPGAALEFTDANERDQILRAVAF